MIQHKGEWSHIVRGITRERGHIMRFRLFSDRIVPSTEFNRHPDQILDEAISRSVTITWSRGDLVLLPRSQAAAMVQAAEALPGIAQAFGRMTERMNGHAIDLTWIAGLSDEDEITLISEMAETIVADNENLGPTVEALLYEWAESRRWLDDPEAYRLVQEQSRNKGTSARNGSRT